MNVCWIISSVHQGTGTTCSLFFYWPPPPPLPTPNTHHPTLPLPFKEWLGLPLSGKNIWKMISFFRQGKLRELCDWSGKFGMDLKSQGIWNLMAVAVFWKHIYSAKGVAVIKWIAFSPVWEPGYHKCSTNKSPLGSEMISSLKQSFHLYMYLRFRRNDIGTDLNMIFYIRRVPWWSPLV